MTRRGPGRPPAAEPGVTREQLLTVALDLFARNGYAGTSVRAIASAAGLSDAGLYGHFSGKQAIYDELLHSWGPVRLESMGLDLDGLAEGSAEAGVSAIVDGLLSFWEQPRTRAFSSVLLREAGGSGDLAGEVERARGRLAPLFEHWIRDGRLAAGHDPHQLVWELVTPLIAVRFLYLQADCGPEDARTARALAERHRDFFLHAAQNRKGTP